MGFLFWTLAEKEFQENLWSLFWKGLIISTWVLVGIGVLQYFHRIALVEPLGSIRIIGPLLDTNSFAAWMNLLGFAVLGKLASMEATTNDSLFSKKVHPERLLYLLTLTGISWAFWETWSRGGFLSFFCTFLFATVAFWKLPKGKSVLAFWGSLQVIGFALFGYLQHYNMFFQLSPGFIQHNISTVSRMDMWIAEWHMFLAHPFLGTGLGTYFLYYPQFRLPQELSSAGTYGHNDYLQFLVEGGPINTLFLLIFAASLFFFLYKLIFRSSKIEEKTRITAIGLVLGVFAITGHALGNFIFYDYPLSFLAGIFMARAWSSTQYHEETQSVLEKIGIRHPSVIRFSFFAIFGYIFFLLLVDGICWNTFGKDPFASLLVPSVKDLQKMQIKLAPIFESIRPESTQPWVFLGSLYENLAEKDENLNATERKELAKSAIQQYHGSLIGIPEQYKIYQYLANTWLYDGKYITQNKNLIDTHVIHDLQISLYMNPQSISARTELANQEFFLHDHPKKGISLLKKGLGRALFPTQRATLQWDIGFSYWKYLGDKKKAEYWFIRTLQKKPDFYLALQSLRKLEQTGSLPK